MKRFGLAGLVLGAAALVGCSSGFEYKGRIDEANVHFVRDSFGETAVELSFDSGRKVLLYDDEGADFKIDEILVRRPDGSARHLNKKYLSDPTMLRDAQNVMDSIVDRVYAELPRYGWVHEEVWKKF